MHPLLAFTGLHLDDVVETVEALVRLESPSTDKAAVDRCGAELAGRLREAGADVELLRQESRGDHILAKFGGSNGSNPVSCSATSTPCGQSVRSSACPSAGTATVFTVPGRST